MSSIAEIMQTVDLQGKVIELESYVKWLHEEVINLENANIKLAKENGKLKEELHNIVLM